MNKVKKIKGIDCPNKYLLIYKNTPILFANLKRIADLSLVYLTSDGSIDLNLPANTKKYLDKVKRGVN